MPPHRLGDVSSLIYVFGSSFIVNRRCICLNRYRNATAAPRGGGEDHGRESSGSPLDDIQANVIFMTVFFGEEWLEVRHSYRVKKSVKQKQDYSVNVIAR